MRRVTVRRHTDPAEFLAAAEPLLLADEARHNLILGLAGTLRDQPGYYPSFNLWLAERDGAPVAAALRTPPFNLVLAEPADDEALTSLAEGSRPTASTFPASSAPFPRSTASPRSGNACDGVLRRARRSQGLYQLREVRAVTGVSGRPRVATSKDAPLLVEWVDAFVAEALPEDPSSPTDSERMVEARLRGADSGILLWEDDDAPVSLAGWGGPTPTGIRIGPVYTPPEHRRRGYGSAVTAAVSSAQLARRSPLLLPLHRPRKPDLEQDLRGHRLRAGLRRDRLRVRPRLGTVHDDLRQYWDFGDVDGSERRFRERLEQATDDAARAEVLTQLARVCGLRDDFEGGQRLIEEARELAGDDPRASVRIELEEGRLRRSSGDPAAAYPLFEAAYARAIEAEEPYLAGDAAHMAALAAPDPASSEEWTERGIALGEAEERARYWLGPLLNNIGWAYYEEERYQAALAAFERALAERLRDPENVEAIELAHYAVAKTLRALGRPEDAIGHAEAAVDSAASRGRGLLVLRGARGDVCRARAPWGGHEPRSARARAPT